MNEIRSFSIEFREDSARQSPGRLIGTILRYEERASDRPELFEKDSLTWPEDGIIINRQHSRQSPIMRVIPVVKDGVVLVDAPLPDTSAGRDAARELRDKLFTGLSVEFRSIRETFQAGIRRISSAALFAAALVDSPSYTGSMVEVRTKRTRVWL